MNKVLYVVLDGLGDDPLPELDNRTPLEAARTPWLDRLARSGANGLVYTVGKGIAPESDIAVFAVLGYDPRRYHSGRGPMEALGSGMDVRDGDLVYRINFATVTTDDRGWRIEDRRVGRDLTSDQAKQLAEECNANVKLSGATAELLATVEHRGALLIRRDRAPLSAEVTNTDPAYAREGALGVAKLTFDDHVQRCEPLEDTEPAKAAAELTNEYLARSHDVLDSSAVNAERAKHGKLKGNMILTRDGGDHLSHPPPFRERYGAEWGCFVEMPVERGISMVLGMGQVEVPMKGAGTFREQYGRWAEIALEAIEGYDGLYIHIKGPDVPAHDGRAEDKLAVIEDIDEAFFGTLMPELREDAIVAVTADHATSCAKKAHTDEPVPLVVAGPGVSGDAVERFGERAAAKGSIGLIQGVEIMPRLMSLARA